MEDGMAAKRQWSDLSGRTRGLPIAAAVVDVGVRLKPCYPGAPELIGPRDAVLTGDVAT
jgi:hypothetical protein